MEEDIQSSKRLKRSIGLEGDQTQEREIRRSRERSNGEQRDQTEKRER